MASFPTFCYLHKKVAACEILERVVKWRLDTQLWIFMLRVMPWRGSKQIFDECAYYFRIVTYEMVCSLCYITIVWFQVWCATVFQSPYHNLKRKREVRREDRDAAAKGEINHEESFSVWYESTHCVCLMQWLSHWSGYHSWMPSFM